MMLMNARVAHCPMGVPSKGGAIDALVLLPEPGEGDR